MNLNSRIFDRIRTRQAPAQTAQPDETRCDHPGCVRVGEHRAPMGRDREGLYFCFCIDHVREYNATYNYFDGMSDAAIARYQKDAIIGHRPTWTMGVNRTANDFRETGSARADDALARFRARFEHRAAATQPRRAKPGMAATRALHALGLDEDVEPGAVKVRYKELVKKLHPDANGGDRANEDKLREIIKAYNYLRMIKLA